MQKCKMKKDIKIRKNSKNKPNQSQHSQSNHNFLRNRNKYVGQVPILEDICSKIKIMILIIYDPTRRNKK
jgi:hypothetical protein